MEKKDLKDGLYAVLHTSKGEITLFLESEKAPMTTANFVGLAEGTLNVNDEGKPFYNNLTFHRVIENFMIQGVALRETELEAPVIRFQMSSMIP